MICIYTLKAMVEDGFAVKRISTRFNWDVKEIKSLINKHNFKLKSEKFSEDKIPHILNLYQDGVSAKSLGIKYSIDKRRVQKWAREQGIERSRSESHRFISFNENFFDVIDTADKSYWLGYWFNNVQIKGPTLYFVVRQDEKDHLIKFCKAIEFPIRNIKRHEKEILDDSHEYYFQLDSFIPKDFFEKKDYFNIKPHLKFHFLRGVADNNKEFARSLSGRVFILESFISEEIEISFSYIQKIKGILDYLDSFYKDITPEIRNENNYKNYRKIQKCIQILEKDRKTKELSKVEECIVEVNAKEEAYVKEESKEIKVKDKPKNKSYRVSSHARDTDFSKIVEIDGQPLTAKYIKDLSKDERERYVEPLFKYFRNQGWMYPVISDKKLRDNWNKLCELKFDLNQTSLFNNSSVATLICKHFCPSFCHATEYGKPNMLDLWEDDEFLYKLIRNRLVISWDSKVNETFNISHRMMIQGMRSMRAVPSISIFKPSIAKFVCEKYSDPGDIVGDYSAGFGGRMLGAVAAGRRYQGTDPLTIPEVSNIAKYFNFEDKVKLIQSGSEEFRGEENSLDLIWSSPPYFDQEYYSDDETQAYNKGEEYFYNVYWKKTLENCKYMLKPGKWFGLNVKNYPKMIDMACEVFGDIKEKISLRTIRSHLNKGAGVEKYEYIHMFKN